MSDDPAFEGRVRDPRTAAVVVAHPGHELLVYHWMETRRPLYFCLTDGSGGSASSRMASTTRLLEGVGAAVGPPFGRYPDREAYRLLLDGRVDVFVGLARALAGALAAAGVECVAGDAAEGFNPVHDVCRFVIDGAVAWVRRTTGREIRNYDFVLEAAPGTCPEPLRAEALWLRLDDDAVKRKLAAAEAYPEMRQEARAVVERFGPRAYALECLRPARTCTMVDRFDRETPEYERSGQVRVEEGVYREVIRYRQHVRPVREAIEADRE